MEIWQTVLIAIGGNAVLLSVLGWLAKSFVGHQLTKDFEGFKHDLQLASLEHKVKFSSLHEIRAGVIAELYSRTIEFLGAAQSLSNLFEFKGEKSKEEKASVFGDKAAEFREYYIKHKIYFSTKTCEIIDRLWEKTWGVTREYAFWLRNKEDGNYQYLVDSWLKANETLENEVTEILDQLQSDFRTILGAV